MRYILGMQENTNFQVCNIQTEEITFLLSLIELGASSITVKLSSSCTDFILGNSWLRLRVMMVSRSTLQLARRTCRPSSLVKVHSDSLTFERQDITLGLSLLNISMNDLGRI